MIEETFLAPSNKPEGIEERKIGLEEIRRICVVLIEKTRDRNIKWLITPKEDVGGGYFIQIEKIKIEISQISGMGVRYELRVNFPNSDTVTYIDAFVGALFSLIQESLGEKLSILTRLSLTRNYSEQQGQGAEEIVEELRQLASSLDNQPSS